MTLESQFASHDPSGEPFAEADTPAARHNDPLGTAEWAVINMALQESARFAKPAGALTRLTRKLIGTPRLKPLANRKLETLRSFAIAAWFRDEIPTRQLRAMFSVGCSSNDVARIIAHIAAIRGVTPEVEAWP